MFFTRTEQKSILEVVLMRVFLRRSALIGSLCLAASPIALSSTLNLTDTVTATGTLGSQTYSVALSGLDQTGNQNIGPTTQLNLGNSVTLGTNSDFNQYSSTYPLGAGGSPYEPWNFQDDYQFSTTGATVQTAVIALTSIGGSTPITDLQARIILGGAADTASNTNPVLGPPPGGTAVDGWQNLTAQTITFFGVQENAYAVTMPTALAAGSYILQIRGEAATSATTAYGGAIGFTPVPVPAAAWLLLSGITGLGLVARGRKTR